MEWAPAHAELLAQPCGKEGAFVASIYAVEHFQANIEKQKILRGSRNADPFLIARAACNGATVLTIKQFKANGAKIANIFAYFRVPCLDLRAFMQKEQWVF